MRENELTDLFLRYRAGDAGALATVFDRTAPKLLRVARRLIRDKTEAEDLLQATYLAAIERAMSFDGSRPLEPWLVGILANQAGLARRRTARTIEAERLWMTDEPEPGVIASARELDHELTKALDDLPPVYREVVEPRLREGARSVDLAERMNRAPNVVRMQLSRGLDLLRRALPTGFATGAIFSLSSRRSLAAVRTKVLQSVTGATAPPSTAATASLIIGGWIVSKKILLVAGVLLLVAGSLIWKSDPPSPIAPERPVASGPRVQAPTIAAAVDAESVARVEHRPAVTAEAEAVRVSEPIPSTYLAKLAGLTGRLVTYERVPVAGVPVTLLELHVGSLLPDVQVAFSGESPTPQIEVATVVTDEAGRFHLEGAHAPSVHGLGVDLGGSRAAVVPLDVGLRSGETTEIGDVVLAPSLEVIGQVLDEDGGPVAGARVRIVPLAVPLAAFGGQNFRQDSVLIPVDGGSGTVFEPPAWALRFLDRLPIPTAKTDAGGRFALAAVNRGMLTVVVDRDPFVAGVFAPIPTGAGATRDLGALILERGVTVSGNLTTGNGTPLAEAEVAVGTLPDMGGFAVGRRAISSDAEGHFTLDGIPGFSEVMVAVRSDPAHAWVIAGPFDDDEPLDVELPELLDHRIVVIDEEGAPIPGVELRITPSSEQPEAVQFMQPYGDVSHLLSSEAPGRYRLDDVPPGEYLLVARAPGRVIAEERMLVSVLDEETEVTLSSGSTLSVRVTDAATGTPIEHALVAAFGPDREIALVQGRSDRGGDLELTPLSQDRKIVVRVDHPGYATTYEAVNSSAGNLDVRLGHGGKIQGTLTLSGSAPPEAMMVMLWRELANAGPDGVVPLMEVSDLRGDFVFHGLTPGQYRYEVHPRVFVGASLQSFVGGAAFDEEIAKGRVVVHADQTTELIVSIITEGSAQACALHGRVMRNGQGWKGARVRISGAGDDYVDVDSLGNYRFSTLPAGETQLMLFERKETADGYTMSSVASRRISLRPGEMAEENFEFEVAKVVVEIRSSAGGPVGTGIDVSMIGISEETQSLHRFGVTDERGKVELTALRAGKYRFDATHSALGVGRAEALVPSYGLSNPLRIDLDLGVPCAGTVEFSDDLAVGVTQEVWLHVHAVDLGSGSSQRVGLQAGERTFSIAGLTPGNYRAQMMIGPLITEAFTFALPSGGSENLVLRFESVRSTQ